MKNTVISVVVATMLSLHCLPAALADGAGFSYRRVYELLYKFHSLAEADKTHLAFRGRAVNPAGPPPDQLIIQHGDEPIIVPVDRYGLFEIPMSPQLAQLNPRMTGDPPADILRLGLAILVRLPDEGTPDAAWLLDGIRQANAAIKSRSRVRAGRLPRAHGVTLRFAVEDEVNVGVIVDGDVLTLEPDDEGRVDLPLDPEQHAEAVVSMSHRPQVIFPLFD